MLSNYRWIPLLFVYVLVSFLISRLNSWASTLGLYFYIGGLYVIFPAILGEFLPGLILVTLTGFFYDATAPMAFGRTTIMMIGCYIGLFSVRAHLRLEKTFTICAQFLNAILILTISLSQSGMLFYFSSYWLNVGVQVVSSTLLLGIMANWFMELQKSILYYFNKFLVQRKDSQLT